MSGLIHKIALLGREFTIQTEYIPGPERKIRTLVYDGGRLVSSREIAVGATVDSDESVEARVREQHKRITDTLIARATELQAARTAAATPKPTRSAHPPPAPKGMPRPMVEVGSPLEVAIAVRRTIGPFGLAFARPAPTTANECDQLLEAVETAIDGIMRSPTWEHIRLDEQLTMIAIRGQLASWRLANKDLAVATEIWPSIENFAFHQQKISNRSDLVAFDHKLLTWAMSELGKGGVSDELVDGLRDLGGRDTDLDHVLEYPEEAGQHDVLEILMRLLDQTFA